MARYLVLVASQTGAHIEVHTDNPSRAYHECMVQWREYEADIGLMQLKNELPERDDLPAARPASGGSLIFIKAER